MASASQLEICCAIAPYCRAWIPNSRSKQGLQRDALYALVRDPIQGQVCVSAMVTKFDFPEYLCNMGSDKCASTIPKSQWASTSAKYRRIYRKPVLKSIPEVPSSNFSTTGPLVAAPADQGPNHFLLSATSTSRRCESPPEESAILRDSKFILRLMIERRVC
jgi:hypothetical protein